MPDKHACDEPGAFPCPGQIATRAGRALAERHKAAYLDTQGYPQVDGEAAIIEEGLQEVKAVVRCPGAVLNQEGEIVCPLGKMAAQATMLATGPLEQLSIDRTKVGVNAPKATDHATGQYL